MRNLQLFITEGAPFGKYPAITDEELGRLQGKGILVAGYVNLSIVEHTRFYWDPDWTDNRCATGNPTRYAPAWMHSGARNDFGIIVNFDHPEWQQLVFKQAKELVSRGYTALFLDDVGRYYDRGGNDAERKIWAAHMITLVQRVSDAVGSSVKIIVNGAPWIVNDIQGHPSIPGYLKVIDALLLECLFGVCKDSRFDVPAIEKAIDHFGCHAKLFALENSGTRSEVEQFYRRALKRKIVPGWSMTDAYNTGPPF